MGIAWYQKVLPVSLPERKLKSRIGMSIMLWTASGMSDIVNSWTINLSLPYSLWEKKEKTVLISTATSRLEIKVHF